MMKQSHAVSLMALVAAGLISIGYFLGRNSVQSNQVAAPAIIQEKATPTTLPLEEPHLLTYQNRTLGFQFDYPDTHIITEKPDGTISLNVIAGRGQYGSAMSIIMISKLKKQTAEELFKQLSADQAARRKEREDNCRKNPGTEGFDMCAYYGGGDIFSRTTFVGKEAVKSEFSGEGDARATVYLPSMGFAISYDGGVELPVEIKNFTFIDADRIVSVKTSGISFVCPAFWTCNPSHNRDYMGVTAGYELISTKNVVSELLVYKASVEETNKALERDRTQQSGEYLIEKEYVLRLKDQNAAVLESKNQASIYFDQGGLIRIWPYGGKPDQNFVKMFIR